MYWLSGDPFEDRCKYISEIKSLGKVELPKWMTNEVFAPFINNEETIENWIKNDYDSKFIDIYDFIMFDYKESKCS